MQVREFALACVTKRIERGRFQTFRLLSTLVEACERIINRIKAQRNAKESFLVPLSPIRASQPILDVGVPNFSSKVALVLWFRQKYHSKNFIGASRAGAFDQAVKVFDYLRLLP